MVYCAVEHAAEADARRRMNRRRSADTVLEAARHMPAEQRLTLEQVYLHGLTVADLARLTGESPGIVRRRLNRLLRRLRAPIFRFVVEQPHMMPRNCRRVARLRVLHGLSLRDTARATGLSLHHVRMHMQTVMSLCELTTGKTRNDD